MALNCNTCTHKNNAIADGHCSEFHHIPALDACAMYDGVAVVAAPVAPSNAFLWLGQAHPSVKEVKTPTPL